MSFISMQASGSGINLERVRDLKMNIEPMNVDTNSSRVDERESNTQRNFRRSSRLYHKPINTDLSWLMMIGRNHSR